jgi:hypothetical protein
MPSTVVHVAFALLVAAALLGHAYDRRALIVVAGVAVFADLDVFTSLVVEGSHRAMFHTLLIPLAVGTYLYADTRLRDDSLVRAHYGAYGVRVAWVALAAFCLSAVGLDLFTAGGVNPFYPLHDQFYALTGDVTWSAEGLTQTFVEVGRQVPAGAAGGTEPSTTVDVGQKGSTAEYRVASGVDPTRGPEPAGVERVFPVVYTGWQTVLVLVGVVVTGLRLRERPAVSVTRSRTGRDTETADD